MFQIKHKLLFTSIGILSLLFSCVPVCFAAINAAPHLGVGAGARSLGLGGAFTAIADDATATIWNPAGLPSVEDMTITVSSAARVSLNRKHNFIGAVKKIGEKGALGLAVINAGVDDIPFRNARDRADAPFNYNSNAFSVSYGHAVGDFNIGGTVRLLTDSFGLDNIAGSSETGFGGVDLGFLGHGASNTISYGAAVRNLGGSIAGSDLPVLLAGGAAFKILRKNVATFSLDVEHEFVDLEEATTSVRIGAEYLIANTFAIRGGSRVTKDRRRFFAGFGVNVGGLQLDYALQASDDAVNKLDDDSTHLVSLSYSY